MGCVVTCEVQKRKRSEDPSHYTWKAYGIPRAVYRSAGISKAALASRPSYFVEDLEPHSRNEWVFERLGVMNKVKVKAKVMGMQVVVPRTELNGSRISSRRLPLPGCGSKSESESAIPSQISISPANMTSLSSAGAGASFKGHGRAKY